MSITITGGISFSGGVGIVAPPSVATAGWYGGGELGPSKISTVNRMTFATDTATASVRGSLSIARYGIAGAGTLSAGWFSGGYAPSVNPGFLSRIDRITYATDTATASVRGPLSQLTVNVGGTYAACATSDGTTYGWIGSIGQTTVVNRITYATDTDTASNRGPLVIGRTIATATGDTSYGWYIGGNSSVYAPPQLSQVDRITYATDTATASARGPLTTAVAYTASVTDSTYGWVGAGAVGAPTYRISTVQRITFATDTATSSTRGPLVATRYSHAGTCDNTYGWFAAGYANASPTSSVTRITFATDTATSTDRGFLTGAFANQGSSSGLQ
jgi:hypothetical protein